MPPEELAKLIATLVGQTRTIDPTLLASAMPNVNVSPANITSAMSPNVLLTSGLVDPSTINAGIAGVYQQMLADWESRGNANLPPEASDLYLSPVTNKYSLGDEVSNFMTNAFDAIKNQGWSVEQVQTAIQNDTLDMPVPKAIKDNLAQYNTDIKDFAKRVDTQNEAKLKFEITQQQAGVDATPPPTLQQARQKFYKDLGAPEMALLPDVSETYQFDPTLFADKARTEQLDKLLRIRESQEGRARTEFLAKPFRGPQSDIPIDMIAEQAKKDYLTQAQSQTYPAGDPRGFLAPQTRLAEQAGAKAVEEWLSRRAPQTSMPTSNVSVETNLADASRRAAVVRQAQLSDAQYQQDVADYVSKKLAARGVTPNKDVMNQLLGYAATVAKKK